jgi:hypothetical protein
MDPAGRMTAGPGDEPADEPLVGCSELTHDVVPRLVGEARRLGGLHRFDDERRQSLDDDAAQQLAGGRHARFVACVRHGHAERRHGFDERPRGWARGQSRGAQPLPVHRRHERHVGEAQADAGGNRGQAPLEAGRRRGKVGVDGPPGDGVERLGERRGGVGRRGDAEHQVGASHRGVGVAVARHAVRGRHVGGVVSMDLDPRGDEVASDERAGLAEPEDADARHARHPTYSTPSAWSVARKP